MIVAHNPMRPFIARLRGMRAGVTSCGPMSWADLAELLTRHEVGEKAGTAWMPAAIDPGPRKGERVRAVTALVLDVEANHEDVKGAAGTKVGARVTGPLPPALPELVQRIEREGWAAIVATSHSHEAPARPSGTLGPRLRVVFQVGREVGHREVRALALAVAERLGLADRADTSTMEPARLFFLPRCPAEREHLADRAIVEGAPLPVDELVDTAAELALPAAAPAAPLDQGQERAQAGSATARETVTPAQIEELRSALQALDADDRATWIACGHRLKGLGEVGRELWLAWSQTSTKWQPGDAAKWGTFRPERTGYAGIFKAAQASGWVNPASKAAQAPGGVPGGAPGPGAGGQPRPPWGVVPVGDLGSATLAPQRWFWSGYIPEGHVTLLGAHGGAGKSTVALMLAVSVALGLPLFGVETEPAPVVFFSAEDDGATVRRRLHSILESMGVNAVHLAQRMTVLDAAEAPAELAAPIWRAEGDGGGRFIFGKTAAGAALVDHHLCGLVSPLLIVDNASDTFGGNENARPEVRAFMRTLADMVRNQGGAVLLLAHLDKNAARGFGGGESYSGSTAWHNSARSRLTLERERDGIGLVLKHEKSNLGRLREPLRLVWPADGLPMVDRPPAGFVGAIASSNATRALLRLIHEFTQRGEFVSTATTSRTHAGKLLRSAPGFPARTPDPALFELLRDAERGGLLERVQYMGAQRHARERWEVTAKGAEAASIDGFASTASTASTYEVDAVPAGSPALASTASTSPQGGVGGKRGAEVDARSARSEGAQA